MEKTNSFYYAFYALGFIFCDQGPMLKKMVDVVMTVATEVPKHEHGTTTKAHPTGYT